MKVIKKVSGIWIVEYGNEEKYVKFTGNTEMLCEGIELFDIFTLDKRNCFYEKTGMSDVMVPVYHVEINNSSISKLNEKLKTIELEAKRKEAEDVARALRIDELRKKELEESRLAEAKDKEIKRNYFKRADHEFEPLMLMKDEANLEGIFFHLTSLKNFSSIYIDKYIYSREYLDSLNKMIDYPEENFPTTKAHYKSLNFTDEEFKAYHDNVKKKVRFANRHNNTYKTWFNSRNKHSNEFVNNTVLLGILSNSENTEVQFSEIRIDQIERLILIWDGKNEELLKTAWEIQKRSNVEVWIVSKAEFIRYVEEGVYNINIYYLKEPYEVKLHRWPNIQ